MSSLIRSDAGDTSLAVATQGLSKRYGSVTALESVDVRVPSGAVYLLVGANGAGKSTLHKVLMNLERPQSGTAQVFGLDAARQGPEVRAQIGYVPERHEHSYRWMSCGRLLRHVSAYYPSWDNAYGDHLVRTLDLHLDRKAGALSKGEARRLQLVTALAHRPPLLLLDEPTDGLDPLVRQRVFALIAEHLADTPTTILMTTHHINEVETLVDHIGVLRQGKLVAQLSRDDLQRTVRRYRIEAPQDWEPPPGLRLGEPRRSRTGREAQWMLVGDEREVTEQVTLAGARVHDAAALSLEEAALALLANEAAP